CCRLSLFSIPVFSRLCRLPRSTLFPYTTLFRSHSGGDRAGARRLDRRPSVVALDFSRQSGAGAADDLDRAHARAGKTRKIQRHEDRKSTRLNSSHLGISYAVFCLKKKRKNIIET